MRHTLKLWLIALPFVMAACTDTDNTGLAVQPGVDQISLYLDTFAIGTSNQFDNAITAQCDTSIMALGEFYSERFGSTKAELLVQLAPPTDYQFAPDSLHPTPDSLILYMYYDTWFGSATSPLEISIYEINQHALSYDSTYYSDLNIADFTDESILMGRRVITSVDQTLPDSVLDSDDYAPAFRYKFSDEQLQRFFNLPHEAYQSYDAFTNEFKGLYITTKYGASTLIYFNQIALKLFYHYDTKRDGIDTIVATSIIFPANREVRQLNRFEHQLPTAIDDSTVLVKSPGGMFPRIELPIGNIRKTVRSHIGERLYNVNSAAIVAEIVSEDDDYALPTPTALILMRESHLSQFAYGTYTPTAYDSVAAIATYDSSTKSYIFDLAYIMSYEVRNDYDATSDTETFVIVPCAVNYDSSGGVQFVQPIRQLSGIRLRNSTNTISPMRLKMIYNGF